jgi:hypothetical protein
VATQLHIHKLQVKKAESDIDWCHTMSTWHHRIAAGLIYVSGSDIYSAHQSQIPGVELALKTIQMMVLRFKMNCPKVSIMFPGTLNRQLKFLLNQHICFSLDHTEWELNFITLTWV